MPPLVSVIIVNWNTCKLLRQCLRSLASVSEAVAYEAIVVDNASADGSPEMVASEFPQARLIRNGANVGFVKANNQGLRAAGGAYLFMLNSDAELRPGCLERLVEVLGSDPRIGAVGPRLVFADGTPQPSAGPFPRILPRLLPTPLARRYEQRFLQQHLATRHLDRVGWLMGAALLFPRAVLERVGPPDERFLMWWDDIDWCQRLRRAGYDRVFVEDAVVVHHRGQSAALLGPSDFSEQLLDSEYLYLRLHGGRAVTWLAFAVRLTKAAVRLCLPGGGERRRRAAWFWAYHRRNWRRFCLSRIPPSPG